MTKNAHQGSNRTLPENPELSVLLTLDATKPVAIFIIGGNLRNTATVGIDRKSVFVEVIEGCGRELRRYAHRDMRPAVIDAFRRIATDEDQMAHDLLEELAADTLSHLREERAEVLMLEPITATMSHAGSHLDKTFEARVDVNDGPSVSGFPSTDDCIAALHHKAGSHGYIVTRIKSDS